MDPHDQRPAPTRYCASSAAGLFHWREGDALAAPVRSDADLPRRIFYLVRHPAQPILYAIDLWSRRIVAARAQGEYVATIGAIESGGEAPCHLAVDAAGRFAVVANYNGGVVVHRLEADGSFGEKAGEVSFPGQGPDPKRQTRSHPHGVTLTADGGTAYIADLGLDRIVALHLDPASFAPRLAPDLDGIVPPGGGPRHFAFHPSGAWGAAVNELASTVTTLAWDPTSRALRARATVSTLPPGETAENTTAEIEFHPTGRALYVTNRGHDSVICYRVTPDGGLALPRWLKGVGRKPQHLCFDPAGRRLSVASTGSDEVRVYQVDPATGEAGESALSLKIPQPMCVV